jgi:shikimate dehydrogenase
MSDQRSIFYYIGVTTRHSSIMHVFPRWMEVLGRSEVILQGVDHPLHDSPEAYRRTVEQIKTDAMILGGLVTTHKIDLLHAARDAFDSLDPLAVLLDEVSCISKRKGRLIGHAKDPISSGLSLQAMLGEGYFGRTGGHVLCFGAGGAGKAIALYFMQRPQRADRPVRMVVTDLSQSRLDALRAIAEQVGMDIDLTLICTGDPRVGDQLMAGLPDGSLVINATGMGKDTPGSPVTDNGLFPRHGIAWELNYRGELDFWQQAMAQAQTRHLTVEDGWLYFLHGWTQVVAEVLDIRLDDDTFTALGHAAADLRPRLVFTPRR